MLKLERAFPVGNGSSLQNEPYKQIKGLISYFPCRLTAGNPVSLLGFCREGEEKILVYEFLPNKSLESFLHDDERRVLLDWSTRYKIIGGITQGILYLHEDCRLRIIHRDIMTLLDQLVQAWKHWKDGTAMEVLDPIIKDSCSKDEVIKCIHIGLLFVQEDPALRPSMSSVVSMLTRYRDTLPIPQDPRQFNGTLQNISTEMLDSESMPLFVNEPSSTSRHTV